MITYITHVKVRQTIINVVMKRFTSVIRTIRRQTVANVRKSYPQAHKSYPQVIHTPLKVIHKLSTGVGERVFGGEGAGGRTSVRVAEHPKDSYKFLKLGSLFRIV